MEGTGRGGEGRDGKGKEGKGRGGRESRSPNFEKLPAPLVASRRPSSIKKPSPTIPEIYCRYHA